jgi:hypothetical protein
VHELITDFTNGYDPDRMEISYNILIVCGITMKLVRLIKMCLNKTNSRIQVDKHLSHMFLIQNGLKQGEALSPLIFNFSLECAIRMVQVNKYGLKLNRKLQLLVYIDNVEIPGEAYIL